MSASSREYPDDYEQRTEDLFDRADDRAYTRAQIAAADTADAGSEEQRRSESERLADEDLRRAEVESGSEWGDDWHDFVGTDREGRDE